MKAINNWNYDGKREKGNTLPTKSSQKRINGKKHTKACVKKKKIQTKN